MNNIKTVSKFFRWLCIAIFIGLPIVTLVLWLLTTSSVPLSPLHKATGASFDFGMIPAGLPILYAFGWGSKLLGFAINMIPIAADMLIFYLLIKLFGLYQNGIIFSQQNSRYIRNIGITVLAGQFLNLIYQALISFALTFPNPAGHRMVTVSVNNTNLGLLVVGMLIILVSWIMAEAAKLSEENRYVI